MKEFKEMQNNIECVYDAYGFRITVNAILNKEEIDSLISAVGYAQAEHIRNQKTVYSDNFFVLGGHTIIDIRLDFERSNRSDLGQAILDFLYACDTYIRNGVYHKKTNQTFGGLGANLVIKFYVESPVVNFNDVMIGSYKVKTVLTVPDIVNLILANDSKASAYELF